MANLSWGLHSITSGFLVTVLIFFVLAGIVFLVANDKIDDVIVNGDSKKNNPDRLNKAFSNARIAYILIFIAAGIALLLSILYAGQERAWTIHQGWHTFLYFVTYILLIIAAIYAFCAINELNHLDVEEKNGSVTYLWIGLLLCLLGFIGLTGTGAGQIGMSGVRNKISSRVSSVEDNVNKHLPAIRGKVDEIHRATTQRMPVSVSRETFSTPSASISSSNFRSPAPQSTVGNYTGLMPPSTFNTPEMVSTSTVRSSF